MARRTGLFEEILTDALDVELAEIPPEDQELIRSEKLNSAEVADRIALHLSGLVERAVAGASDKQRVAFAVDLARKLLRQLNELAPNAEVLPDSPSQNAEWLRAVDTRFPDGSVARIPAPETPLLDTTLLTNAHGEPRLQIQIQSEIASADSIDVLMAFIRVSGIKPMLPMLRKHCDSDKRLRVLTTTYTGTTEARALKILQELGAEVRVSYDRSSTRLHAKAWIFGRESGISTAYIGSSNLTHQAQQTGLEWNVRVSSARNRAVIEKMEGQFETHWVGNDFREFDLEEFEKEFERVRPDDGFYLPPTEIRLEPFQERLLECLEISRQAGHHRNLLASATGTGKTVMAAVDYARLRERLGRARLLFVAHREEILQQSLHTFRHALRDGAFGEKWSGGTRPTEFEHVFASIQSLNAAGYADLPKDHYDVVIVDEFHHAAASTYTRLLEHLEPKQLLGLTATPERADDLPVLQWFGDRIAAELRLWDAIDQHRLCPFEYYGIHDQTDLTEVRWIRGRGYDARQLEGVYTSDDAWVRRIIQQLSDHVTDRSSMRALGFCVGVDHAKFMADKFQAAGIPARTVWADTPPAERAQALRDLAARRINVLFSVDLFNEGVDVPAVDTLLMLRPTDSPTLFLQQLGRGLRKAPDKRACLVLDFIAAHRTEYRLERRYRGLLGGTRKELETAVERRFPWLPAGCHMELDRVATDQVLRAIKNSIPRTWPQKVAELRALRDANRPLTLTSYLDETGQEISDVYYGDHGWSDLCRDAGIAVPAPGPQEETLRKAVGRLLHVDDPERLDFGMRMVRAAAPSGAANGSLTAREQRLQRMLAASLAGSLAGNGNLLGPGVTVEQALAVIWQHRAILQELSDVFELLRGQMSHATLPLGSGLSPDIPLQVHARYSRLEIQCALGDGPNQLMPPTWREGVRWLKEVPADAFVFTLDKTSAGFSPTTRYRDYAIDASHIHWESQSGTSSSSPTGQRYQNHETTGSSVLLFARPNTDERSFWFLGPARYVEHRSERPMKIIWKLDVPLPGDLQSQLTLAAA